MSYIVIMQVFISHIEQKQLNFYLILALFMDNSKSCGFWEQQAWSFLLSIVHYFPFYLNGIGRLGAT